MPYKHDVKATGELVRSADWNAMGRAIEDLGTTKVERGGDTITGDLSVTGRLTAPDAQFTSSLSVSGAASFSGGLTLGGSLSVGEITTSGAVRLGNSDLYFTKTDHNHTGLGNAAGNAAIENTQSHGALMILGRSVPGAGRIVKLWDYLQVNGDLNVTGKIICPRWTAINPIYDRPGPLPQTGSFNSSGGTLIVMACGSGFAPTARQVGMLTNLDGRDVGLSRCFANEANSHKVFSSNFLVLTGIAAGTHRITLNAWNSTLTDGNDLFNVAVLEFPF